MAATSSVRLSRKPREAPETGKERGKYQAISPEAQMYGIYSPQYAAALGREKKSTAATILDMGTLSAMSANERNAYAEALMQAQETQKELQSRDAYYGILGDRDKYLQGDVELGMGGVRGTEPPVWDEQYGVWRTPGLDPVRLGVANANVLNTDQAERLANQAGAVKTLGEAGYGLGLDQVGKLITPPTQVDQVQVKPYMTPSDETTRYGTDEGLTAEEQIEIATIKGKKGDGSDDIKVVVTRDDNGNVADVKYEGNPEALIANGIDPETGLKLRPNAGADGGAAPATPAAKEKSEPAATTTQPGHSFFAPEKRTSEKGMRKHPILGTMRMHAGEDFGYPEGTPIPAEGNGVVVFSGPAQDFGNQVKVKYANGSIISYSHNKRNSVKVGDRIHRGQPIGEVGKTGLATGPHVHRQVHQASRAPALYASRLKQHPAVDQAQTLENGDILVTLKDGSQRVYRNGKRVG